MTRWALLAVLLFWTSSGWANFDFNANCIKAHQAVFQLKMVEGRRLLNAEYKARPNNAAPYLIENFADIITILVLEEKATFKKLEKKRESRLKKIKSNDSKSPWYLYSQAEINLQWAFARIKFKEYFSAAIEVREAYKLLQRNAKKFPYFALNNKSLGIVKALIGTVPDSYRWVLNIVGMEGDVDSGLKLIHNFIELPAGDAGQQLYKQEALMNYAYLLLHIAKDEAKAWDVAQLATVDYKANPLSCFVRSSIALRTGQTDEAIKILQLRPQGGQYLQVHYLNFMTGLAKLYRNDADAVRYFKLYVNNFKGQNFIKEAYLKLAWYSLIHNDRSGYFAYLDKIKSHGSAVVDEDKYAQRIAEAREVPDITLLKARLLFDGGYYREALSLMHKKTPGSYNKPEQKTEYLYRMGRIMHKLDRLVEAINYYKRTVKEGGKLPIYYPANASLNLGYIYESLGKYEQARTYFKQCIAYRNHEYRNSLQQKARAGLKRLEKKK